MLKFNDLFFFCSAGARTTSQLFLLIGFGPHYRGHFPFEHKLKAHALELYIIMVKRKAEKQQSAGKPSIHALRHQSEAYILFL